MDDAQVVDFKRAGEGANSRPEAWRGRTILNPFLRGFYILI